jgi:hypothetical protein
MNRTLRWTALVGGVALLPWLGGGCAATYYSVTDPAAGKTYYTPKVQTDKKSGSVTFVDVGSGVPMTLSKPQVKRLNRKQFTQALQK